MTRTVSTKSEDGVVLRVDDFRLKERVTIHVETLALLFSSVKVKRQPITISDEAKQRLKLGVPKMFKSYIELRISRTAGRTSASRISRMVELIAIDSKKVSPCSAVLEEEYSYKEISMGVPLVLGKQGISRIIELDLSQDEKKGPRSQCQGTGNKSPSVRKFVSENR